MAFFQNAKQQKIILDEWQGLNKCFGLLSLTREVARLKATVKPLHWILSLH